MANKITELTDDIIKYFKDTWKDSGLTFENHIKKYAEENSMTISTRSINKLAREYITNY